MDVTFIRALAALLIALVPLALSAAPSADLAITAYRPADGESRPVTGVTLEYRAVRISPADGIQSVLARNGIYADGESLGLLYDLNPALKRGSGIAEAGSLTVPAAAGGPAWQAARQAGFLLALTRAPGLKQELLDEIERTAAAEPRFRRSQAVVALDEPARDKLLGSLGTSLNALAAFRTVIRQRNRPTAQGVLLQTAGETKSLNAILERNLDSSGPLPVPDQETIALISENMELRAQTLREERGPGQLPKPWPEVRIRVNTSFAANGKDAHKLRIYYVPHALYGDAAYVESFDTLTTPTEANLPPANYMIWAGRPGDPKPLSDVKRLRARESAGPVLVELSVGR